MAQDLELIAQYLIDEHKFNSGERLQELLKSEFKGIETDFDVWIEASKYIRTSREFGLTLGNRTDKRVLIRRATYGLTGLPPTVLEVESFLSDLAPDA